MIIPTEEQEQATLATYLDSKGYLWTHVANERKAKPQYHAKLKRLGVKAGVPDVLIFEPFEGHSGLAIELKRKRNSSVSDSQKEWLSELKKRGWRTAVCRGADEAIDLIESCALKR